MAALLSGALIALTLLASVISGAAAEKAKVAHFALSNGLDVVVIPDRRAPIVTHMIWYKVGSADEPWGKSGIAHFLEHLMFKGTEKNPSGRFSKTLAAFGGVENAFTSNDYTGYYQRAAREHLEALMAFEADRMTGLVLTDSVVGPELNVVLEEQNTRVANNPAARLGEDVAAALFLNHTYGRPVIGWRHEIEKLNREDALDFYRRFYAPNNAIVVVAGDVTEEVVRDIAERTYGKIARRADLKPRQRPQEPEQRSVRQVTLSDPQVAQPSLQRSYLVPSYSTAKPGAAEAIEVLAHILGGGSNSRLYRTLVAETGIATNAGGWYQGTALDMTKLGIYATPRPGVTLAQLETQVDAVIAKLIADGITSQELERTKLRLIADAVYAQDNQSSMARWYGAALATGATVEEVSAWPDRIRSVTAPAVEAAARQWLDRRRSVTGYLTNDAVKREEKRS
ncbi:MAG: insulinase family protein [Proteobacteria bacterium]|nr:insulinase family protein [Pseudomonadota bacterium]